MSEEHWTVKLKEENAELKAKLIQVESTLDAMVSIAPSVEQLRFAAKCIKKVSPASPVPKQFERYIAFMEGWHEK